MPHAVVLDPRRGRSYYAATLLVLAGAGCRGAPEPIAPMGLRPIAPTVVEQWAANLRPTMPTQYDVRWRFTRPQGSVAGRAVIRYQGPDTLRFDYRGPFGRSGAAMFVGADVVWAQPAAELRELIPTAPLFWAGLGLPLGPAPGMTFAGLEDEGVRAWRYLDGRDVLDVVWRSAARHLQAEFRQNDRLIGLADVQYDSIGVPATAELRFPGTAGRLSFRFEAVTTVERFTPETWRRP
ncbi:MAG: hypothetical protein WD934_01940 [Gemmatimonadales bacterium]